MTTPNNNQKWLAAALIASVALNCVLAVFVLSPKNPAEPDRLKVKDSRPKLPLSVRFVTYEGKAYLEISPDINAKLDSEIQIKVSKWSGADSTQVNSLLYLIKSDTNGLYLKTDNIRTVGNPNQYVFRLPELLYLQAAYASDRWREYVTFLPGDIVEVKNSLFQPIVIQCQAKTVEVSKLYPDPKGKVFFAGN